MLRRPTRSAASQGDAARVLGVERLGEEPRVVGSLPGELHVVHDGVEHAVILRPEPHDGCGQLVVLHRDGAVSVWALRGVVNVQVDLVEDRIDERTDGAALFGAIEVLTRRDAEAECEGHADANQGAGADETAAFEHGGPDVRDSRLRTCAVPRCSRGRRVRRALSLLWLSFPLTLGGGLGCERVRALFEKAEEQGRAPTNAPRGAESGMAPVAKPAPDAGSLHVELDPAVRRKMKVPPRRTAAPELAFGKGRLGVLTEDSLVVRDAARLSSAPLTFPLDHPRALAALADGSLLAAGASRSLRLLPHDEKSLSVPKITLFPESSLFGDRRNPDRVWVLPGSAKTLFGYDAVRGPAPLAVAAEWIDLEDFDERAFTSVRDGSFLYSTANGLLQFYGAGGRKEPLASSLDRGSFRLLPASRPDTVWVVADRSARLFRILGGKLVGLKSLDLRAGVFDAAAEGELLAVLELAQPDDAPWRFELEVFDVRGNAAGHATLPAEESAGEDWVARLVQNRSLALSADLGLVAVGGRAHLDVLSTRDGSSVFSTPVSPGKEGGKELGRSPESQ